MTTVSLSPYRAALTPLTDIIAAVPDWSAPSPCEGWSALDVLDHVLMTQRGLLAERGIAPTRRPRTSRRPRRSVARTLDDGRRAARRPADLRHRL
ncbi:MAG: maleylpyruvate isomerase N-terminal domain-containing protein [Actinomycetales bacterium]|nr:maleylpyruvate isomerase N-terminal domain-containing protein [Candidatus Phosphoribacter baldrii]